MAYSFSNLCGVSFERGKVSFTPDGNSLLSPVGNRVAIYDLRHNRVATLRSECCHNVEHITYSPRLPLLLVVDEEGHCAVLNYNHDIVLSRISFNGRVSAITFSKCGRYLAVGVGRVLRIWESPKPETGWRLNLLKDFRMCTARITSLSWSEDSNFLLCAAKDLTVRLVPLEEGALPRAFVDNSRIPVGAFFTKDNQRIVSIDELGGIILYKWVPSDSPEAKGLKSKGHITDPVYKRKNRYKQITLTNRPYGKKESESEEDDNEEEEEGGEEESNSEEDGYGEEYDADEDDDDEVWEDEEEEELDDEEEEEEEPEEQQTPQTKIKPEAEVDPHESDLEPMFRELENEVPKLSAGFGPPNCDQKQDKVVLPTEDILSNGIWILENRTMCGVEKYGRLASVAWHPPSELLFCGFERGIITIYQVPKFELLSTMSIGHGEPIDTITVNHDSEWVALGSTTAAQLAVWEWKSESFILKEQGHQAGIRCVAPAPVASRTAIARGDGNQYHMGVYSTVVATGGEDGKVKIWDTASGFNYVTFTEHSAAVNALVFVPGGNAVLSASSDGSVRAYDLIRYRQFRVLTAGNPEMFELKDSKIVSSGVVSDAAMNEFTSLAIDSTGHFVVAGVRGSSFSAYVWNLETGKLVERLAGHENLVTCIAFHPHPSKPGIITSGSLDGTIRVWNLYGRVRKGGSAEVLPCGKGVVATAFDPRGNDRLAVSLLGGEIWFWNIATARVEGTIDGLRDIQSGRLSDSRVPANNSRGMTSAEKKKFGSVGLSPDRQNHYTSLAYSSSGKWILCASQTSTRVLIYDTDFLVLHQIIKLTRNLSLDGILMELPAQRMTDTGFAIDNFDLSDDENEDEIHKTIKRQKDTLQMPGATGVMKKRQNIFQTWQVAMSQSGYHWFAATSHGLFVFVLDPTGGAGGSTQHTSQASLDSFTPNFMTTDITPHAIADHLAEGNYSEAAIFALSLNDMRMLNAVYCCIPMKSVPLVVQAIPYYLLPALLNYLRVAADFTRNDPTSRLVQRYLTWLSSILSSIDHIRRLQNPTVMSHSSVESIVAAKHFTDLRTLCLLLLRTTQQLDKRLHSLYNNNIHALSFICRGAKDSTSNE